MSKELERLLEQAKRVGLTASQLEVQRRSFAYGNTRLENEKITREMVDKEADALNGKRASPKAK
jgi:hypothetical protein